ncbi:hypothetical protein Tco_1021487 [Tanacetum coccineum]
MKGCVISSVCSKGIKTHLGISQEVGTPRYLSLVVPLTKVGDEVVHKELGDRMERAATTASSLEAEQDSGSGPRCQDNILGDVNAQTRFEITSIQSIDPPLSRGYTLGSGEDSMKLIGIDKIFPKFAETHNVVTFLENPEESDGFAEIIDFLKASSVSYALTVNSVIYTSCIEQFWATAKCEILHLDETNTSTNTHLSPILQKVLDLQKAKDTQSKEITTLRKRIQRLERRKKSRPTGLKRLKKVGMSQRIESSEDQESLGAPEDASKQGRSIEDIDTNVAFDLLRDALSAIFELSELKVDVFFGDETSRETDVGLWSANQEKGRKTKPKRQNWTRNRKDCERQSQIPAEKSSSQKARRKLNWSRSKSTQVNPDNPKVKFKIQEYSLRIEMPIP